MLENSVVKTNLYHISTQSDKDIVKCVNSSNETFVEYYKKSTFYCVELIKILSPKIVIFEGKSVYEEIIKNCFEANNTWNKDDNFGYYFDDKLNIHFIGYSRIYSNIKSIDKVANGLKKIF